MLTNVELLQFHLSANQKKCLKEEIHKDVLVTGEYSLSEVPGQTASLKVCLLIFVVNNESQRRHASDYSFWRSFRQILKILHCK